MSRKEDLVAQIEDSMRMELSPIPNESMSISDIDQRISDLEEEFKKLFAASREEGGYLKHADAFKQITDDMTALKEKRATLLNQQNEDSAVGRRIREAVKILENSTEKITVWDESIIRQLVDKVKVLSATRILVYLRGGMEIEQVVEEAQVKWYS